MPKKRFIDKKKSTTFRLIPKQVQEPLDAESRKEEQNKCGIYFDDDYNYLQHVRQTGVLEQDVQMTLVGQTASNCLLQAVQGGNPSSMVEVSEDEAAKEEEDDEVLEVDKAFDDPEGLDDMEDDFFLKANASPTDNLSEEEKDDDDDDECSASRKKFAKMALDDDNAENTGGEAGDNEEEYDYNTDSANDEDDEDVESEFSKSSNFSEERNAGQCRPQREGASNGSVKADLNDFNDEEDTKGYYLKRLVDLSVLESKMSDRIRPEVVIQKPFDRDQIMQSYEYVESSEEEEMVEVVHQAPNGGWDCESFIYSLPSTKKHAPKLIEVPSNKPKKNKKLEEIPDDCSMISGHSGHQPIQSSQSTCNDDNASIDSDDTEIDQVMTRKINETAEEKRLRKQAVKSMQRLRREEKAARKHDMRQEACRQKSVQLSREIRMD